MLASAAVGSDRVSNAKIIGPLLIGRFLTQALHSVLKANATPAQGLNISKCLSEEFLNRMNHL